MTQAADLIILRMAFFDKQPDLSQCVTTRLLIVLSKCNRKNISNKNILRRETLEKD